jgi:hypothetical protein
MHKQIHKPLIENKNKTWNICFFRNWLAVSNSCWLGLEWGIRLLNFNL